MEEAEAETKVEPGEEAEPEPEEEPEPELEEEQGIVPVPNNDSFFSVKSQKETSSNMATCNMNWITCTLARFPSHKMSRTTMQVYPMN